MVAGINGTRGDTEKKGFMEENRAARDVTYGR
jgi:hypothetical protein